MQQCTIQSHMISDFRCCCKERETPCIYETEKVAHVCTSGDDVRYSSRDQHAPVSLTSTSCTESSKMDAVRRSASKGLHNDTFLFTSESVGEGHPGKWLGSLYHVSSSIANVNLHLDEPIDDQPAS